ncbi:MAG: UDP-glucose/GDP-mannose dehydrogenase family protein [Proteobacteria bacterium]|nr:UDP-glucose/GDP-mannose dehydrogenase family protein [Pseudomonadota bacterium]MBU1388720.1 UDP-glucose/GDP-mannose dehydrogenase family protein [Pseudomonadota bacterium]MBU1543061.1 UDP-glucose/GDP-mannose dehydrogenase family protein [Pseudomonadota bacterium]MBU2480510.1 UDP-glucose/GDP-mannose dehydrogenase family protein [Pseudomonadota bacterium]
MNLTIIGTGYVGLVTGACFSEMGSCVTCVDVDENKIEGLKKGILPIYEPGLENLVIQNFKEGVLNFTTSLVEASKNSDVFFIAVGTPPGEDGSADLQYVLQVAKQIGQNIHQYSVIVNKSTVPVGTADLVKKTIQDELDKRGKAIDFDVVSNPEFLKEGAAVNDFLKPDRIIVGVSSDRAEKIMRRLYAPFSRNRDKLILMNVRDAEMTKYAANSMLATKISFMNEISNICEKLGVDVENVRKGIGSDSRIGYSFIYPGCGYGGSCFPKDVKALIRTSRNSGIEPELLVSVEKRNALQKLVLPEKIKKRFGQDLSGRTFCVWGLSFKPGTDDMRDASSIVLIDELLKAGAHIKAYDPVAMDQAKKEFPKQWFKDNKLQFMDNQYAATEKTDALVLVTEWKTFRQPDFRQMSKTMNQHIIFDGRNQYNPEELKEHGFEYHGIGREKNNSSDI